MIDFARIFYLYSPTTSPYPYLFSNDEVSDRRALIPILERFSIGDIIETLYINVGEEVDPMAFLWEVFEHRFPDELDHIYTSDGSVIESFDFLVNQINETTAIAISQAFIKAGLPSQLSVDYFFNNWVSHTAAVFVRKDYDTSV